MPEYDKATAIINSLVGEDRLVYIILFKSCETRSSPKGKTCSVQC